MIWLIASKSVFYYVMRTHPLRDVTHTMHFAIVKSISDLNAPIQHFDSRIFPDNSEWYAGFERYVSLNTDRRCIGYARLADDNDQVLFPTQFSRKSPLFTVLESLDNYYSVDYRPICSTPNAKKLIKPLLRWLLTHENPHMIVLRALDDNSEEKRIIIHSLQEFGWKTYLSAQQANWTHDLNGSFEDYLASRPSRLQNTLRRKTAKLRSLPGTILTVHDGNGDLEKVVTAYHEVYAKSWKVPEPHPDFIPQLIRSTALSGHLRLGIIWQDDVPVAVHFWIVKRQIAFIYKLAHDKTFDNYSPGTVLMGHMIEYTMKNDNIRKLDFLSGDDAYKRDWMSERCEKIQIHAYNPARPLAQWARYRDNHLKPFVKQLTSRNYTRLTSLDQS